MDMSSAGYIVPQQRSALWPDPAADVTNDHLRCNIMCITSEAHCACAKERGGSTHCACANERVRKHTAHAQREVVKITSARI